MKLVAMIILLFVAISSPSFADHSCLSDASKQELLNEVSRRMNGSGPGSQSVVVSLTCNSYQLQIHLTSLDGAVGSSSMNFSNSAACSSYIAEFGSNSTLRSNKIIGSCNSYQLVRKLIKLNATVEDLPSINYSNSTECESAALALIRL